MPRRFKHCPNSGSWIITPQGGAETRTLNKQNGLINHNNNTVSRAIRDGPFVCSHLLTLSNLPLHTVNRAGLIEHLQEYIPEDLEHRELLASAGLKMDSHGRTGKPRPRAYLGLFPQDDHPGEDNYSEEDQDLMTDEFLDCNGKTALTDVLMQKLIELLDGTVLEGTPIKVSLHFEPFAIIFDPDERINLLRTEEEQIRERPRGVHFARNLCQIQYIERVSPRGSFHRAFSSSIFAMTNSCEDQMDNDYEVSTDEEGEEDGDGLDLNALSGNELREIHSRQLRRRKWF